MTENPDGGWFSSGSATWLGRALTGLTVLFLVMDAGGKLIAPRVMIDTTPAEL